MKKLITLLIFFSPIFLIGQSNSEQKVEIIQSKLGLHYINQSPKCNYIIDFLGDSTKLLGNSVFLEIDGKMISVTDYPYSKEQFSNNDSTKTLKNLLLHFMNYEKEYLENEIYKTKLDTKEEFFLNSEGKQFFLWSYNVPKKFRENIMKEKDLVSSPVTNSFLLFISNYVVVGIYISSDDKENAINNIKYLKSTSDNIDVFGGPINKNAWSYKIESLINNEPFLYVDSLYSFKINIPYWFNVTEININNVFSGTLPDINNVKNSIFIQSFKKDEFKSFDEFNYRYIKGNKFGKPALFAENYIWMGQKELKVPKGCNGLSSKVYVLYNDFLYDCQYVTYETEKSYIWINYTSTRETFDLNKNKFDEFLNNFHIKLDKTN